MGFRNMGNKETNTFKRYLHNPKDPNSPKRGQGRFHAEIWVLSWFGIDFSNCSKAQLVATRFFFDALFPFVLLFLISAFTRPVAREHLDRFFGKMHTPVQPTLKKEKKALEEAYRNPETSGDLRFLFPPCGPSVDPGRYLV